MREINTVVIHCADTPSNMDIGAKEIRDWHVNDNGWDDIGYHFIIRRDGTKELGRPLDVIGSHVRGHNANSIGICLVGGKSSSKSDLELYTAYQLKTLSMLLKELKLQFKPLKIVGHTDLDKNKTCPNFDVSLWLKENKI